MSDQMIVHTRGDPLGTVRRLILSIWQNASLDAMLVPINGATNFQPGSLLIHNPDQLKKMNPFKPLMLSNTARYVPGILQDHPGIRLGILLRPCEMRALIALAKRDGFDLNKLVTVCIDCLGTYPSNEFLWRAKRKGSAEALTRETLQFARQGGIMGYRYRSACQLCAEPDAREADVNIGVLGLPVRQYVLVSSQGKTPSKSLDLEHMTDGPAGAEALNKRSQLLARMTERRNRTHDRVVQGIADVLPANIEALVAQFADCGACQACLEACPICVLDFPQRGADNRYQIEDIKGWLASCAGCGMCEQACPQHQPLSAIFTHIHKELVAELDQSLINI